MAFQSVEGARRAPGRCCTKHHHYINYRQYCQYGCGCFYLLLWIHDVTYCDYSKKSKIYNLTSAAMIIGIDEVGRGSWRRAAGGGSSWFGRRGDRG